MNRRKIDVDQIIIVGDLLGYSWAQEVDPLKEGRETLKSMLKKLKECANDIFFLPGNADLRPDLCEDICYSLDVILLTN
jgi:UDP-2,3-diacylglucosamine pyrophosphatase LpxH